MAMGDHLRRHRWSGGPSMVAILGPGGPILGDHLWHDRPTRPLYSELFTRMAALKF